MKEFFENPFEFILEKLPYIMIICFVLFILIGANNMDNNITTIALTFNISKEQAKFIYNDIYKNNTLIQYDKLKAIDINNGQIYSGVSAEPTNSNVYNSNYIIWYETEEYDYELLKIVQFAKQLKVGDK